MIKSRFLLFALFIFSLTTIAQRYDNQKQFKSASKAKYRSSIGGQNNNEMDLLFQTNTGYNQIAQQGISTYRKDNEIIFEVKALLNAKADRFLVVFNLTQIGETATATDQMINSRIDSFITGLKEIGVKKEAVYLDMIYLIPTFEYEVEKKLFSKTYNEVPTGFEMQKNIHISFSDINLIDEMVTLAAKSEIYDLVKLDFFVESTSSKYDTLRSKSIEYLNKSIKDFGDLELVFKEKFHTIAESSGAIYPESQYGDFDPFVSQSIEAVKKKTGVTKIRKPKTVAYDQVPYSNFDIVINPFILEPVVQFTYILQAKYSFPKPENKTKKEFWLVTPDGQLKTIPTE